MTTHKNDTTPFRQIGCVCVIHGHMPQHYKNRDVSNKRKVACWVKVAEYSITNFRFFTPNSKPIQNMRADDKQACLCGKGNALRERTQGHESPLHEADLRQPKKRR